jgi:hypothetical protein
MNETSLALIGYILWMIFLVITIISLRSILVLTNKKPANGFSPTGNDVSPFMERLIRVHANSYEHFPIFGGILLLALFLQMESITNNLAYTLIGLRISQGVIHMISKNILFVYIRLTLFLAQIGITIYWIIQFFK